MSDSQSDVLTKQYHVVFENSRLFKYLETPMSVSMTLQQRHRQQFYIEPGVHYTRTAVSFSLVSTTHSDISRECQKSQSGVSTTPSDSSRDSSRECQSGVSTTHSDSSRECQESVRCGHYTQ